MVGSTIAHYRIVERLGEGGMSVVYKAEDTRLKRHVALKFLRPFEAAEETGRVRFLNEAKAAAALSHPNVCTVYDVHEHEGTAFIAMAYLKGESLDRKLARGPLTASEALDTAEQIACGLQNAHANGVVHRDVKPSNVIVTTDGRATLVDFGLALLSNQSRITLPGSTLGTTAYMSPEQAMGEEIDRRADIWAWGVVLYEMLTGRLPFSGQYRDAIIYAILNEDPEPLTSLMSDVPAALEAVCDKALEKNPDDRYPCFDDLLLDLRACRESGDSPSFDDSGVRVASSSQQTGSGRARQISLGWWEFHQGAVLAACTLLTAALWQVSVWEPGLATRFSFIVGLAAACAIAIVRMHLLFTARFNRRAIVRELSRVTDWVKRMEWCLSGALAAQAVAVAGNRRLIAALLMGAAAAYAVVFNLVEPSTSAAVFRVGQGRRPSASRSGGGSRPSR